MTCHASRPPRHLHLLTVLALLVRRSEQALFLEVHVRRVEGGAVGAVDEQAAAAALALLLAEGGQVLGADVRAGGCGEGATETCLRHAWLLQDGGDLAPDVAAMGEDGDFAFFFARKMDRGDVG